MKAVLGVAGMVFGLAVVSVLWASQCSGADPRVLSTELEAPLSQGEPYIARAVVENTRGGKGSVSVEFRLRSPDGLTFDARTVVNLGSHERVTVIEEIQAPYAAGYVLEARADYPVR